MNSPCHITQIRKCFLPVDLITTSKKVLSDACRVGGCRMLCTMSRNETIKRCELPSAIITRKPRSQGFGKPHQVVPGSRVLCRCALQDERARPDEDGTSITLRRVLGNFNQPFYTCVQQRHLSEGREEVNRDTYNSLGLLWACTSGRHARKASTSWQPRWLSWHPYLPHPSYH